MREPTQISVWSDLNTLDRLKIVRGERQVRFAKSRLRFLRAFPDESAHTACSEKFGRWQPGLSIIQQSVSAAHAPRTRTHDVLLPALQYGC